jgi:hypothetical protein
MREKPMKRMQQQQKNQKQRKKLLWLSQRSLVIVSIFNIVFVIAFVWIVSILGVIPTTWSTMLSAIASALGVLFNVLELVPSHETWKSRAISTHSKSMLYIMPIVVQVQLTQSPSLVSSITAEDIHREIINISPPTDANVIQQLDMVVKEICGKFTELSSAAGVVTSIDSVNKSMLAAIASQYAEVARPHFEGIETAGKDNRVDLD